MPYRRKKKARRSRSPYVPRSRGGGGYRGPSSYVRHHDFKYDRGEPPLKLPQYETHHERTEKAEHYRNTRPSFRTDFEESRFDQLLKEAIEHYRLEVKKEANESTPASPGEKPLKLTPEIQELTSVNERLLDVDIAEPKLELTVEAEPQPEPLDASDVIHETGPELYESYELAVNDIEMLLAELDANPLENELEADRLEEEVKEQ